MWSLFIVWVFAGTASTLATIPPLINYQGQLKDATGAPLDGFYPITFAIYNALNGNAVIWTEMQNVSVNKGSFNVLLGSTVPFPENTFNTPDRWLGIKIGSDPELTPRRRLVSTPYAFESLRSDGSIHSDSSEFAVTVAPNSINSEHIVDGQVKTAELGDASVTSAKILDRTIAGSDIAFNAITSAEISTGAVRDLEILDGTVNTVDLADNSVNSAKIANGTVSAIDIGINAVNRDHLSDEPGVAQVLDGSPAGITLASTTPVNILSRSMSCPASGYVLAIVSCNLYMATGINAKADLGISQVSLTFPWDLVSSPANAASNWSITFPFSMQRIFAVTAGVHTFYFVGSVHPLYSGPISAFNAMMSLVYFPTSYGTVSGATPVLGD